MYLKFKTNLLIKRVCFNYELITLITELRNIIINCGEKLYSNYLLVN